MFFFSLQVDESEERDQSEMDLLLAATPNNPFMSPYLAADEDLQKLPAISLLVSEYW